MRGAAIVSGYGIAQLSTGFRILNAGFHKRFLLLWVFAVTCALSTFAEDRALFLSDEKEAALARWDLIAHEQKEIVAAVHIWEVQKLGLAGLAGLVEAAKRGVKVRLVIDGLGGLFWRNPMITPAMAKALADAGIEFRIYRPVQRSWRMFWTAPVTFNRMHHKLLYFGSQNLVLSGDRNFQNTNFPGGRKDGKPTNSMLSTEGVFQGPAASEARAYIDALFEKSEPMDVSEVTEEEVAREQRRLERVASVMKPHTPPARDWQASLREVEKIEFAADAPQFYKDVHEGSNHQLLQAIGRAQNHLKMTVPFALLSREFQQAVADAARRGVKVTLLVTGASKTWAADINSSFWIEEFRLRRLGVETLTYTGDKWLHAKLIEIDGKEAYVGSHNFNPRSTHTDLESGFLVRDPQFAKDVGGFLEDLFTHHAEPYRPPRGFQPICVEGFRRILQQLPVLWRQF